MKTNLRETVALPTVVALGCILMTCAWAQSRRGVSFKSFNQGEYAKFLADYQPLVAGKPTARNLVRCALSVHELKRQGQAVDWKPEAVFTADPGAVKAFQALLAVLDGRFDELMAIQEGLHVTGDEWLGLGKIVEEMAQRVKPAAPEYGDLAAILRFLPATRATSAPSGVLTRALAAYSTARPPVQKALHDLLRTRSSGHRFSSGINPQTPLRIKLRQEASRGNLKDPALVALLTVLTTDTRQRLQLATEFVGHGQKEAAAVCARTAVEAAPDDPSVVRQAAAILNQTNQPDEVCRLYRDGEKNLPYPGKRLVRTCCAGCAHTMSVKSEGD